MTEVINGVAPADLRRFKPYPQYKDSGVDWLGDIPAHWDVKPLFAVASERDVRNRSGAEINVLSLSYGCIVQRDVSENFGLLPESFETYQVVVPGNIVLRLTDLQNDKRSLRVGLVKERGIITSAYVALDVTRRVLPSFCHLLLHSYDLAKVLYGLGGGVRQTMKFEDLKWLPMPIPGADEQRAIAAFLERETAKIDALVAQKERLIDLLQEQRTALITRAVTRGLSPNVLMRDSGVEWLGEIPAHWDVKRLKYLVPDVTVGIVVNPSSYYVDEGVPCLRSLNISGGEIDNDNLVFISDEANELHKKSKIFEGDVVVVRTGQAGTAAIIPAELNGANCIDLLIIRRSDMLKSRLVYYYLNSRAAISQAVAMSVGAIQSHYNTSTLVQLLFPVIPIDEQHSIVKHLDEMTRRIDLLTAKIRDGNERSLEFRSALISAAVTGKIDVREGVA